MKRGRKKCNKLFIHLTCASTEVPSKTWTNIHSSIIHISDGLIALKLLIHENCLYLLRWCVSSAREAQCAPFLSLRWFYPAPYLPWKMSSASAESGVNWTPAPTAEILLQTNKRDGAPLPNPVVGWNPLLNWLQKKFKLIG